VRFGQTLRDAPADADLVSHKLLVRGGFIRRVAAGVYAWLPPGLRVLRRIERIVREEMDAAGAAELLMPILQPAELWRRSGRWDAVDVLYRLRDRSEREFCLGPTHEEVVTFLASTELGSYRDLPQIPYQIQWKFRDEPRPRGGLLRSREFLMADAYSFDADESGLQNSYTAVVEAFSRMLERCGVTPLRIEAQAGMMGGAVNHEFVLPADAGEDTFVACDSCDYAANTEAATSAVRSHDFGEANEPAKVHTPGLVTVPEVAAFLGCEPGRLVKALLYRVGDQVVCALVAGDRELNEHKLARMVGGAQVDMLTDADFAQRGWAKGFSGPVGLDGVRILADRSLEAGRNLVCGANEADHHLVGVQPGRDFVPDAYVDLVAVVHGDACDRCGGTLAVRRGVEVAHVFQLGTRYADALEAGFTDRDGHRRPFEMGCYGFGISRVVACIVEAHHDDRGISWPRAVAPADVAVLVVSKDPAAGEAARKLRDEIAAAGVEVVLDDREGVSPGARFADADLVGYPLQVVVGKTFVTSGRIEVKQRATGDRHEIEPTAGAVTEVLAACP
jgi:prolyl-tRNA synthetase